jgi:hypothetical protein
VEREQLTEQEVKLLYKMRKPDNRIDVEEAMAIANEFKANVSSGKEIVANLADVPISNRMVNSVSVIRSSDLKKSELKLDKHTDIDMPDTLAYILNYSDSSGYAIVSADARIDYSVLAFSEKGSFNRDTDNPGVRLFLERLDSYLLYSIIETERQKDSLLSGALRKLNVKSSGDLNVRGKSLAEPLAAASPSGVTISVVGPLLTVAWGQEWPFNGSLAGGCQITGDNPEGKVLTGCVATSVAQLMAYWQPSNVLFVGLGSWSTLIYRKTRNDFRDDTSMPKDTIKKRIKARALVSYLHDSIGRGVNMTYRCLENGGSGTSSQNALLYLRSKGFAAPLVMASYDLGKVTSSLNNGRPLLARGCDGSVGCHSWVIDGYLQEYGTIIVNGQVITTPIRFYYTYNNWG